MARNEKTFGIGNTAKKGKASPGSGRTPEWLKAKCQKIIDRSHLLDFLGQVVAGECVEKTFAPDGNILLSPAAVRDRLKAAEMLLDRCYGKAPQSLGVTGADGGPLQVVVVNYAEQAKS